MIKNLAGEKEDSCCLACLLKPDPQQLLCAQFLCRLAVMFRFAVSAMLCLHLLPGHAMRATQGTDARGSCDAKSFAGWTSPPNYGASTRDGVTYGQCGYEADTAEEKCSTYYAEGLRDEGTFYQCRWLSATGKSGKQVNLCVTWSGENKEMNSCSSNKPEIVEILKAREDCHAILCGYARSGKWKGDTQSSHFVGAWTPWPQHTLDRNTRGWSKVIEKECSLPLHSVWANSLGHWGEDYRQYFNKSTCGCMSEDKC